MEYIQLFMQYESDEMPVVFFYEVDLRDDRLALREMHVFANGMVKLESDLYDDVIEVCPIPTVDELNAKVWGDASMPLLFPKKNLTKYGILEFMEET